jgi:hypothetical protein
MIVDRVRHTVVQAGQARVLAETCRHDRSQSRARWLE